MVDKPKAVIFDLDGTLANIGHRLHFITGEKKDWAGFNAALSGDEVKPDIAALLQMYWDNSQAHIIIVTGRQGTTEVREDTIDWLHGNDLHFDDIYFRNTDDFRSDFIIKKEIYEQVIEPKFQVTFVVDDRDQVVEMWRSLGLTCLQCQQGDY